MRTKENSRRFYCLNLLSDDAVCQEVRRSDFDFIQEGLDVLLGQLLARCRGRLACPRCYGTETHQDFHIGVLCVHAEAIL